MARTRVTARGFTLMEVLIAVSITGLMGALIVGAFNSGFSAKEMVETDAEKYRMLRVAMGRMTREIGSAFVTERYDTNKFRDQNDRPTNFVGESDRLLFSSLSNQRLYTDAKESDQVILEYSVKTSPDREARGRKDLVRRANPIITADRMDRGGTEDVLFEGIKELELEYWDSKREDWVDEWDTRRTERKDELPTRVRITLVADDENGKEQRYTTQTRIMLNSVLPRYD